jgi:hypothetical protein
MKKSASCIVINPGVILCVINQSTLVLARVHIIHMSIRSYTTVIMPKALSSPVLSFKFRFVHKV